LETGVTYHYRLVVFDFKTDQTTKSNILTFTTKKAENAIRIPQEVKGPPFILDKADATYILTKDVAADGQAFVITGANVTLDLDGHTVVFGNNTAEQVSGVLAKSEGKATVCNGHIVQGAKCKAYSTAVESRWRTQPTEILGISTDVHLPNAYPVKFLGKAENVRIHHNYITHKRTPGQKVPEAIYIRASGCEIDHNEVVSIDGRGLEPTGENNDWHHNVVDIRYVMKAAGGFYPENRCYGYWARNPNGNRIENNLFVINNEVIGDDTSNTVGLLICTSPNAKRLMNHTVTGNRIIVRETA